MLVKGPRWPQPRNARTLPTRRPENVFRSIAHLLARLVSDRYLTFIQSQNCDIVPQTWYKWIKKISKFQRVHKNWSSIVILKGICFKAFALPRQISSRYLKSLISATGSRRSGRADGWTDGGTHETATIPNGANGGRRRKWIYIDMYLLHGRNFYRLLGGKLRDTRRWKRWHRKQWNLSQAVEHHGLRARKHHLFTANLWWLGQHQQNTQRSLRSRVYHLSRSASVWEWVSFRLSDIEKIWSTVKPVYNDHLMGYFSAFWSSSRWPRAT